MRKNNLKLKAKYPRPADSPGIGKNVMEKIHDDEVRMKPKIYFVVGSMLTTIGLAGLFIGSAFLLNIIAFLLKKHGLMAHWRLSETIKGIPFWIPTLAVSGIVGGIWMLKKYDFSYKKNFPLIIVGVIAAVSIAALTIDNLGLNERWSHTGPMRRFYQKLENGSGNFTDTWSTNQEEGYQKHNTGKGFGNGKQ